MPVGLKLQVEGLDQLERKLEPEVLLAPVREVLDAGLKEAAAVVVAHAPRRTGRLAASVTHRLDARPVPTWGRIAVTARSKRRYNYPRWLEFSPKSPRRGWFRASFEPAKSVLLRHLAEAKQRIKTIWVQ